MIRLGIIGTGRIAKRFVYDAWQGLDVEIVGVYNPHMESAEKFCTENHVKNAYSDWDDFVNVIDAAYVAAPTGTHFEYAEKLLQTGKHVLCEKPMVLLKKQAEYLFDLANSRGCVLVEGVKTAYSPGFNALLRIIESGKIGSVRDVEACFTKLVNPEMREWTHVEDCGSMTELGTYGCFAVTKILGTKYTDVRTVSIRNERGIDAYTKVFFEYGTEKFGLVKAGIGVKSEGKLIVSGTKGYILVRTPWWLTKCIEIHYEDTEKTEVYNFEFDGNGLQYELDYFVKKINGRNAQDAVSQEQSVAMADIMEQFLKQENIYRKN